MRTKKNAFTRLTVVDYVPEGVRICSSSYSYITFSTAAGTQTLAFSVHAMPDPLKPDR